MKEQYRVTNFKDDTRELIEGINSILAEYDGQKLSARQVYYRFLDTARVRAAIERSRKL